MCLNNQFDANRGKDESKMQRQNPQFDLKVRKVSVTETWISGKYLVV